MPLSILTGFLGSGKTTLLQRLLRSSAAEGTGVLINEFGEAGLDHRIVAHIADAAVVQNGCLCCSVRPELTRGLLGLVRKSLAGEVPRFRRVVIETSGLSDPAPIINTVQTHPVLREYFRVADVITTVDTVNGLASFDNHVEVAKQVAVADTIVLTKTDLAGGAEVNSLVERIRRINPLAAIRDAHSPDLDPGALLSGIASNRASPRFTADEVSRHDVMTFSLALDQPADWSVFVTWLSLLLNRHGREVLRFKALLNVAGETAPILVNGVQHILHPPEHMDAWPDEDRRSHLVFIVRAIEPAAIRESLTRFFDGDLLVVDRSRSRETAASSSST